VCLLRGCTTADRVLTQAAIVLLVLLPLRLAFAPPVTVS
jgi:hypothetical protein